MEAWNCKRERSGWGDNGIQSSHVPFIQDNGYIEWSRYHCTSEYKYRKNCEFCPKLHKDPQRMNISSYPRTFSLWRRGGLNILGKDPFVSFFMLKKPYLKVQDLQHNFLDWKWPLSGLFQKIIRFGILGTLHLGLTGWKGFLKTDKFHWLCFYSAILRWTYCLYGKYPAVWNS